MGKINILSFEIANLIAAGEVVERPSSVLKELMENSIDAGATKIVAEIKRGGVALIRVTDNGSGIEKEDLPVALKRHATSKIREREDLDGIMTLGFRGEALAAISSVSEVTIITKTQDSEVGYMLTSEGGTVLDLSEVGTSDGTTVVVENLFFNVPARRKFLKKDSTEAQNVAALVEKVALSHPDISIQLLIDGEEKFITPGDGELYFTVRALYGKEFASKLISVSAAFDDISVSGFIGRSDNVRKNRNFENIFINGRFVKSLTVQAALEKAYTSYIAPECFPSCVLFVNMNPQLVDVNVHPAKLEVKFSDERRVFEAVYHTVRNTLEKSEYRPEISLGAKLREYNPLGAFVPIGQDTKGSQIKLYDGTSFAYSNNPEKGEIQKNAGDSLYKRGESLGSYGEKTNIYGERGGPGFQSGKSVNLGGYDKPLAVWSGVSDKLNSGFAPQNADRGGELSPKESIDVLKAYGEATPEKTEPKESQVPDYKLVGEAFDCYVIIEQGNELLVIDKHAAHERVIFEDLKRSREADGRVASQALLLPINVLLSADEASAAKDFADEFRALGFEFTLGEGFADVHAIPDSVSVADAEGLFVEMASDIVSGKGNPEITDKIRREKALYQIACKAAIKGGRQYSEPIIRWLIGKVLTLPDITVCPHGRPIAYKLKKSELDRQFNRIK